MLSPEQLSPILIFTDPYVKKKPIGNNNHATVLVTALQRKKQIKLLYNKNELFCGIWPKKNFLFQKLKKNIFIYSKITM